jgi:hypothetical protein
VWAARAGNDTVQKNARGSYRVVGANSPATARLCTSQGDAPVLPRRDHLVRDDKHQPNKGGDRGARALALTAESGGATRAALLAMRAHRGTGSSNPLPSAGESANQRFLSSGAIRLLPGRWAIERTLGPLNRNWRLGKDFEATLASATTWIYIASVYLLVRRLARLTQVIEKVLQLLRS